LAIGSLEPIIPKNDLISNIVRDILRFLNILWIALAIFLKKIYLLSANNCTPFFVLLVSPLAFCFGRNEFAVKRCSFWTSPYSSNRGDMQTSKDRIGTVGVDSVQCDSF
jgi:hypothetical protein